MSTTLLVPVNITATCIPQVLYVDVWTDLSMEPLISRSPITARAQISSPWPRTSLWHVQLCVFHTCPTPKQNKINKKQSGLGAVFFCVQDKQHTLGSFLYNMHMVPACQRTPYTTRHTLIPGTRLHSTQILHYIS